MNQSTNVLLQKNAYYARKKLKSEIIGKYSMDKVTKETGM